jgi:hypothetical protein
MRTKHTAILLAALAQIIAAIAQLIDAVRFP